MLSKVLNRGVAGNVRAHTFPDAVGYHNVAGNANGEPFPEALGLQTKGSGANEDGADLRERLRQMEAKAAAARNEAFEAGRCQGEQQVRLELRPVVDRLNKSIADVLLLRPDLRRRAEKDVVQLALLIAKRVLHRQLTVDEGALTAIARVAFERLTRSESYRVTVHPQFAEAIKSAVPAANAARVRIEPDPDCALGTLTIHSSEGTIDASVDAQLEEINRGLTDRLAGG
jgi:flagellar assembly protein FliH